jgi:glycosyltransferase involved in cell wall biosynthesis
LFDKDCHFNQVTRAKSMRPSHEYFGHPRVSVVTTFLNAEAFLTEAIESVLAQTFNDWEFLLVDDGSTDASTTIAEGYAAQYPEKIRYLDHPQHSNRGMAPSRNLGISNARGKYIAFIDADDVWLPSKLAEQVAILDSHPAIGMVCGTVVCWASWSTGKDTISPTGPTPGQDTVLLPPEAALALYPLGEAPAPYPSDVMIRTELVKALGGFEEQFTNFYDDLSCFAKLYLVSAVYFSSKTWVKYRLHENSSTALVTRAKALQVRQDLLEWFEGYLAAVPGRMDPRVIAALRRALRPSRYPRAHFVLMLPSRLKRIYRRLRGISS